LLARLRGRPGNQLQLAGHDTRALQAYLGQRNIQHTVKYTELAPNPVQGLLALRRAPAIRASLPEINEHGFRVLTLRAFEGAPVITGRVWFDAS
jgi:hypothetical protein